MIVCPYCEAENIEGADECEACGEALTDLSRPRPGLVGRGRSAARPHRAALAEVAVDRDARHAGRRSAQEDGRRAIGCVMVVDKGKLVGIFSERDALMKLNTDAPKFIKRPISQFMTPDPVTLETSDKIAFALHKMNVGGYRHIPILFEGKLAGVISIRDILRYLTERIAAAGA